MNFTYGIIAAVGCLVAFSLGMIALDPGFLSNSPIKPLEEETVCTKEYDPVCGVDGTTFENFCMLNSAKIDLDHQGECVAEKPILVDWERKESTQHPGVGHESHQAVNILPITTKIYSGTLKYDASEPVQLITIHGPLDEGEEKGQSTWSPDGNTKYALTFVDDKKAQGEWIFSGNALYVHTKNTTPFSLDWKVDFTENTLSDTVKSGTVDSMTDPGLGHESHQLSVILNSSTQVYSGILSYSASEPIQLISLLGPVGPDEKPAKTWTPDGKTIYKFNLEDPQNSMGSWKFLGNAIGIHTKNSTQFTVSYSVSATGSDSVEESIVAPTPTGPMTHIVSVVPNSSSTGCEVNDECYLPNSLEILVGDTVSWVNDDIAAHTVTSVSETGEMDGIFDSSMFMSGSTFEHLFKKSGTYHYFCMVHPWMTGKVTVN